MSPLWILRRFANVSPFFNSLSKRLRITNYCLRYVSSSLLKFTRFIQENNIAWTNLDMIGNLQQISKPKIIQPEWISKLICNLWLYTLIPKIKSISQIIVVTTKYLAKFQSPTTVSWRKIVQPERISKLICSLWLYTDISCLGGVFAKNTCRETKNFPSRMASEI